MPAGDTLQLPSPCILVLVGPGASGKSSWATENFPLDAVVSSDRLRALVGTGEDDITASADAFALLEQVVALRIGRRLTTVIDTLGLDGERRRAWLAAARDARIPCVAVTFDVPAEKCRARNRQRERPLPAAVLTAQLRSWRDVREAIAGEGFDLVIDGAGAAVRVVPQAFATAAEAARRQAEEPASLRISLHLGSFALTGGAAGLRASVRRVGSLACSATRKRCCARRQSCAPTARRSAATQPR